MNTILITGGMGFIGSNFIRYILKLNQEFKIINVDKITYAGNPENLREIENNFPDQYKFYKNDICDFQAMYKIIYKEQVDYIINFAAESHVDRSIDNSKVFLQTNIIGTNTLLNVAKKNKIRKFLQISSDEVYKSLNFEEPPVDELTPLSPNNPYSASKASADLLVNAYYKTYGLPVVILRSSNNYGPYQYPEKLIPLMIYNALNNKELPIYGKGINIRDWIHVLDNCSAILKVLLEGTEGETYNVGGSNEISNIELVKKILKILNKPDSLIKFVKDRPGHDLRYALDHSKITKKIKWNPKIKFKDGLERTVQWYLDNMEWLENIITKEEYLKYYEKQYINR